MRIPIIDLREGDAAIVSQVEAAARGPGFFYVVGHGVPREVVEDQFEIARRFFELDAAQKDALPIEVPAMRGYERLGAQTLDAAALADLKESFQCGLEYAADHPYVAKGYPSYGPNRWPEALPLLRQRSERYIAEMQRLASRIMGWLAASLDLPNDHFRALDRQPVLTLRMLRYPPQPADADPRTFGAGAHTDWGLVTLLAQDHHGGLEVLMPDGEWTAAPPLADSFVVNLGDVMPRLTNGRYRSNPHRVRNLHSRGAHRQSIACFADMDYEARLTPVAHCFAANERERIEPFSIGEHMREMYQRTYGRGAS